MAYRFPNGQPAVLPATITRIDRYLPAAGEILVNTGSRVEPDDLIGRCSVQSPPVLLDLGAALGVEPRDVPRRVRPKVGERVAFGEVIAHRGGRSVPAPVPGTLAAIDAATGFVVLTPDPVPASVTASVRGTVVEVAPSLGVTIELAAAVVQGMFGWGGDQWAVVRRIVDDPAAIITPDLIDARSSFTIVIGGAGITAEALRKAHGEQVRGIVVGSVDEETLRAYWGSTFAGRWSRLLRQSGTPGVSEDGPTLLMTEGFGSHPMSRPIFDLLGRFDQREAYLTGTTRLDSSQHRPRIVLPIARPPAGAAMSPFAGPLQVGSIVRILDEAHRGQIGRVESFQDRGRLPSGLRTQTARVQIGRTEWIVVPEIALDIIR